MSASKNTMPEMYDGTGAADGEAGPAHEETRMNESEILAALLELGRTKDDAGSWQKVRITRNGAMKLEFRVRPLSEDENQACWRRATKYAKTKPNEPKTAIDTDLSLYRSHVIYAATVDEDRARIWDSKKAQEAFGVLQGVDMVDKVLLAGEKTRAFGIIDDASGGMEEAEDAAKNL